MRILMVDTALSQEVVRRLVQDGHQVTYYAEWHRAHPEAADLLYGSGLFEKWGVRRVENWEHEVSNHDLVVFPDLGWGDVITTMRQQGVLVFGAGRGEVLEQDRKELKKLLDGFQTLFKFPAVKDFSDIEEAIEYVKSLDSPVVIQVNTIGGSDIKTYVSRGVDDAIWHLRYVWEKTGGQVELIVKEKVEGIEVAIGGFFDGTDFVLPLNVNYEHKALFPYEIGPLTGEMGTTMHYDYERDFANFHREFLRVFSPMLRKYDYRGYFDVNCIVNTEGFWILEATTRFGYPTVIIQHFAHKHDFGQLLYEVACGTAHNRFWEVFDGWLNGICWNAEGYPFSCVLEERGYYSPIFVDHDKLKESGAYLGLAGVIEVDGQWKVAPSHGRAVVLTGMADTLPVAVSTSLFGVKAVYIPRGYYRPDVGVRVREQAERLFNLNVISRDRYLTAVGIGG
jgi:phosphoribosylamine--glycine ligase